jgi:hypothetical protein
MSAPPPTVARDEVTRLTTALVTDEELEADFDDYVSFVECTKRGVGISSDIMNTQITL